MCGRKKVDLERKHTSSRFSGNSWFAFQFPSIVYIYIFHPFKCIPFTLGSTSIALLTFQHSRRKISITLESKSVFVKIVYEKNKIIDDKFGTIVINKNYKVTEIFMDFKRFQETLNHFLLSKFESVKIYRLSVKFNWFK